jgi:hypothetical protein
MKGDLRCVEGRIWRHDPQDEDPYCETDRGECEECGGKGCETEDKNDAVDSEEATGEDQS